MAISFNKYVDITSGVGASNVVRDRDLIGRIFTTNPLLPTKSYIEVDNATDVGIYFGTTSEEYKRAVFYFSWVSKNITRPRRLSFARWADAAVAPMIFGAVDDRSLSQFTSITDGSLTLTLGADTNVISGLNFSGAVSLSGVAAIIQTAIRNAESYAPLWENATVTYDAVRKSFNFVGGATGAAAIDTAAGNVGTSIANMIGWLASTGAILSDGSGAETVTETLVLSADASNNFGSFLFIPALSIDEIEEIAQWNNLSTNNFAFQFLVRTLPANAQDYFDVLENYGGVGTTISDITDEYPEMIPMLILAATDYNRQNSVQNYQFQQFAVTPLVKSTILSNNYDAIRMNYYGETQTAGQFIPFYQQGVLMGTGTAARDMNVYANEQWLKTAMGARIMSLLLALARVPANEQGRSQLMAIIQEVINRALFNGTISVGKELDGLEKVYITDITADPLAWQQVQNNGYWFDCRIERRVAQNGTVTRVAVYALVYSKDDAIRKVEGTHTLI